MFFGGGALEKKMHLVKWLIVCRKRRKGVSLLNKAIKRKWCWFPICLGLSSGLPFSNLYFLFCVYPSKKRNGVGA